MRDSCYCYWQILETQKGISELHLLAEQHTAVADLLAIANRLDSTWQLVHHRAFDEVIARAVQSVTLRLLTLWSAGSTPRPTNQ